MRVAACYSSKGGAVPGGRCNRFRSISGHGGVLLNLIEHGKLCLGKDGVTVVKCPHTLHPAMWRAARDGGLADGR